MKPLAIFGYNGFARETADIAADLGYTDVIYVVESIVDTSNHKLILESDIHQIVGTHQFSIGVGDGNIRKLIFDKFPNLNFCNLIHPSVTMAQELRSHIATCRGAIFAAGVRLTNSILVSDFVVLNLNVTVGHDSVLNSFVSVMPGANISGNVNLMPFAYVGTGATILQGKDVDNRLVIGERSVVGAGSLVRQSVEPGSTVVGNPARELKRI